MMTNTAFSFSSVTADVEMIRFGSLDEYFAWLEFHAFRDQYWRFYCPKVSIETVVGTATDDERWVAQHVWFELKSSGRVLAEFRLDDGKRLK